MYFQKSTSENLMNIRSIIIDDERKSIDSLKWKLSKVDEKIDLIGEFTDAGEGLNFLKKNDVDLLFLDIEMPSISGIEFVQLMENNEIDCAVIFVTGHEDYILEALRHAALDYLLKPVDVGDLTSAILRFRKAPFSNSYKNLLKYLKSTSSEYANNNKIALPTTESIVYVNKDDINYCASDSNYTRFYFTDGSKIMIAKTLGKVEDMLGDQFIRIHNSFIINKNLVAAYHRGTGGSIKLEDGTILPVSKGRKEKLLKKLNA